MINLSETPWPTLNCLSPNMRLVGRLIQERWRGYALQYLLAFGLMAVVASSTAASAWLMRDVVNRIFVAREPTAMFWVPIIILVVFVAKGFAAYFQEIVLGRIGSSIVADTQKRVFKHLLQMDTAYYQAHPSNELIAVTNAGAQSARDTLNLIAVSVGRDLLTLVNLILVMVYMDPVMAIIAISVGPIASVGLRKLVKQIQKVARSEIHSTANIIGIVREATQGVRIVKSFQLEPILEKQMDLSVDAVQRMNNKMNRIQAAVNPLIELLGGLAIASVVAYAGWRTQNFNEAPGQLFAFITSLLLAADPARRLSKVQIQLASLAPGLRMLYDLLDMRGLETDGSSRPTVRFSTGDVVFEDVTFSYKPDTYALKQASLTFQSNKISALVGPSGSGKSTVFNLIQGLWRCSEGAIRIDGRDINDVSLASVRSAVAYVSQDAFLFHGTIRDNIRCSCTDASDEDIIRAAELAYCAEFIDALPHKYETSVGELGGSLSGGQRQRIAIARAFLKNAPIVLLDEPTSALDSNSEAAIQRAFQSLSKGRTTVVIAHRLSTIVNADIIYYIEGGRVVQAGPHRELMRNGGPYSKMYSIQYQNAS